MKDDSQIQSELRQLNSCLAGVGKNNPYTVPENYFNDVAEEIYALVKIEDLKPGASTLFDVPENYFETLPQIILSKIHQNESEIINELKELYSSLATVQKINPYSVPENYFNNLKPHIDQSTLASPIKKPLRSLVHSFTRYSVAALVIIIIFIGIFYLPLNGNKYPSLNYDVVKNIDIDAELQQLPATALEGYINNVPKTFTVVFSQTDYKDDFNESIEDLNNAEINYYLNEMAGDHKNSF